MTAAEEPNDFQDNFHVDESENSMPLLSEEDSDSIDRKVAKIEVNKSDDSSSAEFPGSSRTENSGKEMKSSDGIIEDETKTSEKSDDEWMDIMGSGEFKKKVRI